MTPVINEMQTAARLVRLSALNETDFRTEIIAGSGCHYNRADNTAVFGVWAPGKKIILNLAGRDYVMQFSGDFSVLVMENVTPGMLYYYSFPEKNFIPDIYSYYQPQGVQGASMVIDQDAYPWQTQKNGRQIPVSITKLHIGTATPAGTFKALQAELLTNKDFTVTDALEFLPLGCFPGRFGWGYDGGPNFISSVSENYGTPDELKALVDTARARGIKVGFDMQLNHYGPEGIWQEYYYPDYLARVSTEWGRKPNFADKFVRQFLLGKLKEFCLLYQPDYLRLDMSSRYGDDGFIQEICALLPDVSVILEDERETVPEAALAQWSFPAVHILQELRAGRRHNLQKFLEQILPDKRKVIFADSHDEQGNNLAAPLHDRFTPALTALTAGIAMHWYAFGYFHFFCDYQDDRQLVSVTAEKCGALRHYPDTLWPRMTGLQAYFRQYGQAQEFFAFLHALWHKEREKAQEWINNNPQLPAICRAYNQTIFALANIANQTVPPDYPDFIYTLKKLRKENNWMYGADIYYNTDNERKILHVSSVNRETKKTVRLNCALDGSADVQISEE